MNDDQLVMQFGDVTIRQPVAHPVGSPAFALWLRRQGAIEGLSSAAYSALFAAACADRVAVYPRISDGRIVVCRPDAPSGEEPRISAAEWWQSQQEAQP